MSVGLPLSEDDLHAFADNQLPAERAQEIAVVLAREPALAGRVAEIKRQNALLRDALDPWLAEALPHKLLHASSHPPARSAWQRLRAPLAVAATLVIGVALGWYGREEMLRRDGTPISFSRQAALTHALYAADVNRPVEMWASDEQRLVTWLSKRINFPLRAPDLNGLGYSLVGGRLVAGNEKPAALFMYENADKQRISLLVRRDDVASHETAFRYAREDGVSVFYWIDDACGYAISGRVDKAQLLAIARVVYGQLAAFEAAQSQRP